MAIRSLIFRLLSGLCFSRAGPVYFFTAGLDFLELITPRRSQFRVPSSKEARPFSLEAMNYASSIEPRRGSDFSHAVIASRVISVREPALTASSRPFFISEKMNVRPTPVRDAASSGENASLSIMCPCPLASLRIAANESDYPGKSSACLRGLNGPI